MLDFQYDCDQTSLQLTSFFKQSSEEFSNWRIFQTNPKIHESWQSDPIHPLSILSVFIEAIKWDINGSVVIFTESIKKLFSGFQFAWIVFQTLFGSFGIKKRRCHVQFCHWKRFKRCISDINILSFVDFLTNKLKNIVRKSTGYRISPETVLNLGNFIDSRK